jgi:choline dehydrogenase
MTSETYDYIIVGSGSAGAVIASRLSEKADLKVLLLEAGGPDTRAEIHVPFYATKLFKTRLDWAYYTEEEPHLNFRRIYWPRGKVLGGSSSSNFMTVQRGHPHDFDRWCELGNSEWSFSKLLPYYKKLENHFSGPSEYHGVGGPVNVARLKCINPLTHVYLEAAVEAGFSRTHDHNGAHPDGVDHVQVTQKGGRRWSVVDGYLTPARGRQNLTIKTHAPVTSLMIDKKRVRGVTCVQDGKVLQIFASREVILCGGVINSPQLLMLSGIGPADPLKSLGIPIVLDLPGVGQNLQDHFLVPINYHCKKPISLANAELAENQDIYMSSRDGPLTSNQVEGVNIVKTDPTLPVSDLSINFVPNYFLDYGFKSYDAHAFNFYTTLRRAESVGDLTLFSKNPFAPPRVRANYLSKSNELKTLLKGVKIVREIAHAKPFAPYRGSELDPGKSAQTESAIADYIRNRGQSEFHPVGTCKMGNDPLAVVDQQLRVRGIEGLRVADASIFPTQISVAANITVIMIGEKAAAMISKGEAS